MSEIKNKMKFCSKWLANQSSIGKKIKNLYQGNNKLIVYNFFDTQHRGKKYKNYIKLLVSSENMYYQRYRTVNSIVKWLTWILGKKIVNKVQNLLQEEILGIKLWKRSINKKVLHDLKSDKTYAILSNKIISDNHISVPYFLRAYEDDFLELSKKYKQNRYINRGDLSEKKFCAFIVSNWNSKERIRFFKKLSKYKQIDSFWSVYKSKEFPKIPGYYKRNIELYKEYKFVIAFENSYNESYITEKLTNALFSSAVPIYKGASDINNYFNPGAFINYDDFASEEDLIEWIMYLDSHDEAYMNYFNVDVIKKENIKIKLQELDVFYQKIP